MTVLFLVSFLGRGGIEKYLATLIREFSERKLCKCILVYGEGDINNKEFVKCAAQIYKIEMRGVGAIKRLFRICREEKVDVIHAQGPREACFSAALKALNVDAGIIYTVHFTSLQPLRWRIANRVFSRFWDSVISVCKSGVPVLVKNGISKNKISVVQNGTEASMKKPGNEKSKTKVLITVSRFSEEKGILFLVECLARLKKIYSGDFKAYIIGQGELLEEVENEIKKKGLEENVFCIGYKENVREYLKEADIYLLPSKSEALSIAALEAVSEGLPVVATDVGGNTEIVCENGECGYVSAYGDVNAFSENIKRLLCNDGIREAFSKAAYHKAEKVFSIENQILKTYEEYKKQNGKVI